jgi:hypothetical protein
MVRVHIPIGIEITAPTKITLAALNHDKVVDFPPLKPLHKNAPLIIRPDRPLQLPGFTQGLNNHFRELRF